MINRLLLAGLIFFYPSYNKGNDEINLLSDIGPISADLTALSFTDAFYCVDNSITGPYPQEKSDTSVSEKTKDQIPAASEGFLKKLFKGVSKAEKNAIKETRTLQELKNIQTRIYGWYPSWNKSPASDQNYNLLTTFSFFSIDGKTDPSSGKIVFNQNGIDGKLAKSHIKSASMAGCRIDVTFRFADRKTLDLLFLDKIVQDSCISSMIRIMNRNYLYDGLCIEFEGLPPNISSSLVLFLAKLKAALEPSKRTIKLALPAKDYANNYDILKLNQVVDTYLLMCYNYYTQGTEPGPVSPLDDKKNISVKNTVKEYLDKGIPYDKMIAVLPFYGIVWKEDRGAKHNYSYHSKWTYRTIKNNLAKTGATILFDSVSCTNYYDFQEDGSNYRCYFDNEGSLDRKYKWLIKQGIAGVGIWALGYDHGNSDFWDMIEKNYKVVKLAPLSKEISIGGKLRTDTVDSYIFLNDSLIHHTIHFKDTLIKDTLFSKIIGTNGDSVAEMPEKKFLSRELAKLQHTFQPLLTNRKVALTIVIVLLVFGMLGIIGSLLFHSVRKHLYITSIPVYIVANIVLLLAGWGVFTFLRFLKADIEELLPGIFRMLHNSIWIILIISWLVINLLSIKLMGTISLRGEKP